MSVQRLGSSYRLDVGMATLVNVFAKPGLKAGLRRRARVAMPSGATRRLPYSSKVSRFQFTGKVGE